MPERRGSHRFAHVDTLRAVAALLVFLAHVSERFSPLARVPDGRLPFPTLARALGFGRLGVLLFFAISGFVIYASLRGPREHAGRRFVITRFCRLYPAYWLSLGLGLLVFWWCRGQTFGPALVLANATMLPRLLHAPLVLGVYWTLETELVFYALCWALWRGDWLENRRVLVGLVVGFCAAWLVLRGLIRVHALPANLPAPWKALPRHLALMCWGAFSGWSTRKPTGSARGSPATGRCGCWPGWGCCSWGSTARRISVFHWVPLSSGPRPT